MKFLPHMINRTGALASKFRSLLNRSKIKLRAWGKSFKWRKYSYRSSRRSLLKWLTWTKSKFRHWLRNVKSLKTNLGKKILMTRRLKVWKNCTTIFRRWTNKSREGMTRWSGWRLRLSALAIQGCIPASCRQSLSLWTWWTRSSPVSLGERCPKTWTVCIVFKRVSQWTRLIQTRSILFELI
jgi:hypothetical protein